MKAIAVNIFAGMLCMAALNASAQLSADDIKDNGPTHLYIDVHHMPPGKVHFDDVAGAHAKDLAVQDKYGVKFIKYWVDEKNSNIYCLASAADSSLLRKTHGEAHGLLPDQIFAMTPGQESAIKGRKNLYLDLHEFGPGNVTASAVAEAHKKDLATQHRFGVNFINYWVDEKEGVVMCLAEAKDAKSVRETHKAAHGLLPVTISKVKEGQ